MNYFLVNSPNTVDSICQDESADWERESSKMSQIYSNSYLTIAATGSSDDCEGFLSLRNLPDYVEFDYSLSNGLYGAALAFSLPLWEAGYMRIYSGLDDEPLSKRGWALQERYLPPRILHFASKQMHWECCGHFLGEDGFRMPGRLSSIYEDARPPDSAMNNQSSKLFPSLFRGPDLWYYILQSYCRRNLSKSSDKLPALSGIARIIEERTGDKFVAGLWRGSLLEGMLWSCGVGDRNGCQTPSKYRAPSWSWASIDGWFTNTGLKEEYKRKWTELANILDVHVELKGDNPYGEIKSAWVKIRAPLELLSIIKEKETDVEIVHNLLSRVKTKAGNSLGSPLFFDTVQSKEALKLPLYALVLVQGPRTSMIDDSGGDAYHSIVVTPVDGKKNHYRRVARLTQNKEDMGDCDWMEDPSKMVTITLI